MIQTSKQRTQQNQWRRRVNRGDCGKWMGKSGWKRGNGDLNSDNGQLNEQCRVGADGHDLRGHISS